MKIFSSESTQQKLIGFLTKLATLIISTPATISLATRAYPELNSYPLWQMLVVVACVLLVECAFLFFWLRVDSYRINVNQDSRHHVFNILASWIMYGVLLGVGLAHGEGMLALVFRASMGLMLLFSTYERLVTLRKQWDESVISGTAYERRLRAHRNRLDYNTRRFLLTQASRQARKSIQRNDGQVLTRHTATTLHRVLGRISGGSDRGEGELSDRQVRHHPAIAQVEGQAVVPLEETFEVVYRDDGQIEIRCLVCRDWSRIKDTRLSALRAGASHAKVHSNGHSEPALVEE